MCIWCVGKKVGVWASVNGVVAGLRGLFFLFFFFKRTLYGWHNQRHLLYLLVVLMLQLISGYNFKTKATWKTTALSHSSHLVWNSWVNTGVSIDTNQGCAPIRSKWVHLLLLWLLDSLEGLGHTKCSLDKLFHLHLYLLPIALLCLFDTFIL